MLERRKEKKTNEGIRSGRRGKGGEIGREGERKTISKEASNALTGASLGYNG